MPGRPKALFERGILRPRELALLQRVLVAACDRRGCTPESDEGQELTLTIIALYEAGMVDERELLDAVAYRT